MDNKKGGHTGGHFHFQVDLLRQAYIGDDEYSAREILKKVEELFAFREELSNEPSTTSNRHRGAIILPINLWQGLKTGASENVAHREW